MTDFPNPGETFKIGVDICSIERIEQVYQKFGERFLDRILTEKEKAYVTSSDRHLISRLAARFAAKEASAKALGTGISGIGWKDVEVGKKPSGEPGIILHDRAKTRAHKLGLKDFQVSLSHERAYAIAFVVALRSR